MTDFQNVFDAFLGKLGEDEWIYWEEEDMKEDWINLMMSALPQFRFPKIDLEFDLNTQQFNEDLNNEEIQIIATYMKCEWLNRTILTWENVKPLYEERDFSQANLLDKFKNQLEFERKNAEKLEAKYYRSNDRKPFSYRNLATQL